MDLFASSMQKYKEHLRVMCVEKEEWTMLRLTVRFMEKRTEKETAKDVDESGDVSISEESTNFDASAHVAHLRIF